MGENLKRDPWMYPWHELTRRERCETVFVWIVSSAFGVAVFVGGVLVLGGYLQPDQPTEDQRYGCTLAQQASNGDCP